MDSDKSKIEYEALVAMVNKRRILSGIPISPPVITQNDVAVCEKKLGVRLPKQYINFAISSEQYECSCFELATFQEMGMRHDGIVRMNQPEDEWGRPRIDKFVWIYSDGCGNYSGLKRVGDATSPNIYFWNHEHPDVVSDRGDLVRYLDEVLDCAIEDL